MLQAVSRVVVTGALCAICAHGLSAQTESEASRVRLQTTAEPAAADKVGKELHAFRITGTPPRIDGRLDDEAWLLAPFFDDFIQNEPDNMQAPSEQTTIRVLYDDRYLYVGATCLMRDPSRVTAGLGRRDRMPPSDIIRLVIDPKHDHQTAYEFDTNPSAVQGDTNWYNDTYASSDYDAVWEVRTEITGAGWTAEYRIPFSQMRFQVPAHGAMVWGFGVRRDIRYRGEFDRWTPSPRGVQGLVSRLGHLVFDQPPAPARRIEVLPYTSGKQIDAIGAPIDRSATAGADVRVGMGSAATLSATANPDFGQVEQDPSVLNLTVFETFFPEKRPFFLEDSRTFVLPYSQMPTFYSRRIGAAPGRIPLAGTDTVIARSEQTTILGAAKLTGKSSGWTYGALSALTSSEYATVDSRETDAAGTTITRRRERLIEPRTSYNVGRLQHDFGASNIGIIGTAVVREQYAGAVTGGGDYNLRWQRNTYVLNGHWVGTRAPFSFARVEAPDTRAGFGGVSTFNYNGKHLGVYQHVEHFSRNFRNSDLGFLSTRVDKTQMEGGMDFIQPDPGPRLRNWDVYWNAGQQWNGTGVKFDQWIAGGVNTQFLNFSRVNVGYKRTFEILDDLDTRGGPPILRVPVNTVTMYVGSDSRKLWTVSANLTGTRGEDGSWSANIGPGFSWQPSPRLQTSASASYLAAVDAAQWITNRDADGDGVTDNVYGRLRRNVLSLTGRATYAFTRDLTLELYMQPFVAVGDYSDTRKLSRPNSFDFRPVALTYNPDFNRKSIRSNIVARWEYMRGSALFVVWQTSTSDQSRPGQFSPLRDLGTAFSTGGTNALLVKINYWFGL